MAVTERHTFSTTHESEVNIAEQPDQVKVDADQLILATIKHNDDIKWVDGHGGAPGFVSGLEDRLTEKVIDGLAPKCDKVGGCVLGLRFATDGTVANTQVLVSCPAMEFKNQDDADAQLAKCEEVHAEVPGYIAEALNVRAENIADMESDLFKAQREVARIQSRLNDYV